MCIYNKGLVTLYINAIKQDFLNLSFVQVLTNRNDHFLSGRNRLEVECIL